MIPHFDFPFRFVSGHAAVADQDSTEDVTNCVEAIMLTPVGSRIEMPDFGIPDPTFQLQPLDFSTIIEAVLENEPRASVVFDQSPDKFDRLIARVTESVSTGGDLVDV